MKEGRIMSVSKEASGIGRGQGCTAGQANRQEHQEGTKKFTQRQVEDKVSYHHTTICCEAS